LDLSPNFSLTVARGLFMMIFLFEGARADSRGVGERPSSRRGRDQASGPSAGARDNGPPGPRLDYFPEYYAAYVLDPDGYNIEAVYQG
jgi:hypothetical protein